MEGRSSEYDYFLIEADNTSAVGWMNKSNFQADDDSKAAHHGLARKMALMALNNKVCLYTQWRSGLSNTIADKLSRLFELSDDELTQHIRLEHPQVHPNFKISPLPESIISESFSWVAHK
jgi:hypothetical protein